MNLNDNPEYEAKFYPVDKEEYRERLKKLGAKLSISERKMIRFIADPDKNPILPKNDYIRVRNEGNKVRLSYKTSAKGSGKIGDQKEIDVDVSDLEKTIKILELAGIKFNRRQETLREEWQYKNAQITIDTWPGLETYSEIEADSEAKVREIAEDLGFDWNKKIVSGIREVFEKVYGLSEQEVLMKITDITFENNPFSGLKKIWLSKN